LSRIWLACLHHRTSPVELREREPGQSVAPSRAVPPPRSAAINGLSAAPSPADLIRVVVGVGRVDLEPRLHAIRAALRVRPTRAHCSSSRRSRISAVVCRAAATAPTDASIGRSYRTGVARSPLGRSPGSSARPRR
jgi:hypothetical protein